MDEFVDQAMKTLSGTVALWGQVQNIKTQQMLARAEQSAMYADFPTAYQNPQAKAAQAVAVPGVGTLSGTGLLLAFGAFGIAIYLAVK
jgi:hypothetical protein